MNLPHEPRRRRRELARHSQGLRRDEGHHRGGEGRRKNCIATTGAVPTEALLVRMEPRRAAWAVMGIIENSQQLSVDGNPVLVWTLRLEMNGPEEPSEMVAVTTRSRRRTEEATEQLTAQEATPAPPRLQSPQRLPRWMSGSTK
jgi:hypothetical protein